MKDRERLRNYPGLKEIKEAWQQNVVCDSKLDSGKGGWEAK